MRANLRYCRASAVVVYWHSGNLVFDNYLAGSNISADPVVCRILDFCSVWRTVPEVSAYLGNFQEASVRRTLESLARHAMLHRSDQPTDKREADLAAWGNWLPAAGFFHFSTRDVAFAKDPVAAFRDLQQRAKTQPMPRVGKSYPGARRVLLPADSHVGEFPRILKERRTWRKFSSNPVPLADLARLLQLTFGVQGWAEIPGLGRAAMKTSPSGGSLHPIEAYVLARNVKYLRPGIYYYDAKRHALVWLRQGISRDRLEKMVGHQWWFAQTPFLVLMTAVFARSQWKYDYPRVYRAVLLEAGHLCQTFCLTATWQGMAPFCTIALADTKWEKLLGIDGVRESLIYAAGAGLRPKDEKHAHIGKGADPRLLPS
ncbi:MAG: SagB family peptide dehydrogenase [Candidatus Acidiferrales bacterium]